MWGKWPAAMLAIYTGKGVTPEANLREYISCTPLPNAIKATHSETQRRHHQKSETGVSVAPKMDIYIHQKLKKRMNYFTRAVERFKLFLNCSWNMRPQAQDLYGRSRAIYAPNKYCWIKDFSNRVPDSEECKSWDFGMCLNGKMWISKPW